MPRRTSNRKRRSKKLHKQRSPRPRGLHRVEVLEERRLLTADNFLDGLQAFQLTLDGLGQHDQFAESQQLIGASMGERLDIGTGFANDIVTPLLAAGDETALVNILENEVASNPNVSVTTSTQAVEGGEELRVEVNWTHTNSDLQSGLDISDSGLIGSGLAADVTDQLNVHATFGLTPGLGGDREFFVETHALTAGTQLTNAVHDGAAMRGFVGIDLPTAPSLQYSADLSVEFGNPDGDAQGRLSTLELLGSGLHTLVAVSSDPANGFTLNIPMEVTIGDYTTAGTSPELELSSSNPFSPTFPVVEWNADASEFAVFDTITPVDVAEQVPLIGDWLQSVTQAPPLQQALPFAAARSVQNIVNVGEMYTEQVTYLLQSDPSTTSFDTVQELANVLNANVLSYDPVSNELTMGWQLQADIPTQLAMLDVDFPVPSANNFGGLSPITVDASATFDMSLGMDLTPLGDGFVLDPSTPLDTLHSGMGVPTVNGEDDIRVLLRDTSSHQIDLSGASTIGDVLALLTVPGAFETTISPSGQSLVLTDLTEGAGQLAVEFVGISQAAGWLGLWGTDEDHDGQMTGTPLHGDRIRQHFFLQSGSLNGTVNFSGNALLAEMNVLGFDSALAEGTVDLSGSFSAELSEPGTMEDGMLQFDNRISIDEMGAAVTGSGGVDITSLVSNPTLQGTASLTFNHVEIPSLPEGAINDNASIAISVSDIGDLGTADLAHNLTFLDVDSLDGADVLDALSQATGLLDSLQNVEALSSELPFVRRQLREFLDIAGPIQDVLDSLDPGEHTPATLENALPGLLGLAPEDLTFNHNEVNDTLDISLSYHPEEVHPVALDIDLIELLQDQFPALAGIPNLIDAEGQAAFDVTVGADIQLNFGIDLSDPENPSVFVYDSTSVQLSLAIQNSSLSFEAAAGPMGLFIENGSIVFDVDGDGPSTAPGTFTFNLPSVAGGRYTVGNALSAANLSIEAGTRVDLPIAFPLATNDLAPDAFVSIPDLADFLWGEPNSIFAGGPNLNEIYLDNLGDFPFLENLHLVVDGIDWMLGRVEDGLNSRVLDVTLPFLGDRLKNGAGFINDLREGLLQDVGDFLESHPPTPATIQQALFNFLGPGADGINILADHNNDGGITLADVNYVVAETNDDVLFEFKLGDTIELAGGDIDFDIGLPALGLEVDTTTFLNLFYEWDVAFGMNTTDGFYLETSGEDEMQIGLEAGINDTQITGNLGFLQLEVQDLLTETTALTGTFSVDIMDPSGNDRLTMAELGPSLSSLSEVFDAELTAEVDVNLHMRVSFGGSEVFPSLVSDFNLEWDFLEVPLDGSGEVGFGGSPSIAFNNVGVDLGSFVSDFAGPVLDRLKTIMDPIRPVVDALQTRVPVLSDIPPAVALLNSLQPNDEITLVELILHASQSSDGGGGEEDGQSVQKYIEQFLKIYELLDKINAVPNAGPGENLVINLGNFALSDGINAAESLEDFQLDPVSAIGDYLEQVIPGAGDPDSFAGKALDFFQSLEVSIPGGEAGGAGQFEFPLFDEPITAANLLLGRDVDIARYNMEPLEVGFDFNAFFGWFIGVEIAGNFGLTADVDFGFDTNGLKRFVETKNPLEIFNGFYIDDRDENGFDRDELTLNAALNLSAALDLFVARASAGGGLVGNIWANLFDYDNDGKFRINDLVETFPQCMFEVDGELAAEAFAKVTVGAGGLGITKRWDLAREVLASFSYSCEGEFDPILATPLTGGELRLNIGADAAARVYGDTDGEADEIFEVTHVSGTPGNETLLVSAFGYEQEYSGVSLITARNALGGDDVISIGSDVLAAVSLNGGEGDDVLSAGQGVAILHGGPGFDELVGGPANDVLFGEGDDDLLIGGEGNDQLDGGEGEDTLYGEQGDDELVGGAGNDSLLGGPDDDELSGGDGDDELDGEDGDDILHGEDGNDTINGGEGDDAAFGGSGDDEFFGGAGNDTAFLGSGQDVAFGGLGNDNLDGGTGNDELHGEDGNDTLSGNAGMDVVLGGAGNDELHGGSGNDLLEGGHGNDTAYGDAGDDEILGQSGDDILHGGADDDMIEGGTGDDEINGDAGHDLLYGGTGSDEINGGPGQDQAWGEQNDDTMTGGTGNDLLFGGPGNDNANGNEGDDEVFGEDGADTLRGGPGRDRLEGAQGSDTLFGGPHSDLLIGDAGSDQLFGGHGNDIIIGHLIGDRTSTDGEYIEGGPDDDFICGTDGMDEIHGGTAEAGFSEVLADGDPDPLGGGFSMVSCNDPPEEDFEFEPEVEEPEVFPPAQIQGRVFNDLNGNGLDNPDGIPDIDMVDFQEPGLGGFQVYVDTNESATYDAGEPTAFAGFTGYYVISGLQPGTYSVRQVDYPEYALTQPQEGVHEVTVDWGDVAEQVNFGNAKRGGISGTVWNDLDHDHVQDGAEPEIWGRTVYLDLDGDGSPGPGEPTTLTEAALNGYEFTDVAPGDYIVRQVVPDGYIQSYPTALQPHYVTVVPDVTTSEVDFGTFEDNEITGWKWSDVDGDAERDPEEPGIAGVTIYLDANNNGQLDDDERSTLTMEDNPSTPELDETGFYRFHQVLPGDHIVREVVPDYYQQIHPGPGAPVPGGHIAVDGEPMPLNFINRPFGDVHGRTWDDVNGNGGWDEGELGLPGVLVYADTNLNGQFDVGEISAVTLADDPGTEQDESGSYFLTGLDLGTRYVLRQSLSPDLTQSYPQSFDHTIDFDEPGFVEHINFGSFEHATVEGMIWNDSDGNAARDADEPGIPGVVIYSDLNNNGRLDDAEPSTETMRNGAYSLSPLVPGRHTIRQEVPFRYGQTAPAPQRNGGFSTGHDVTLATGQFLTAHDFGNEQRLGDITGTVWLDANVNGVRDAGEPGIVDAMVYLDMNGNDQRDPTDPVALSRADDPETVADESGRYEFVGLEAGRYVVRQDTQGTISSPRTGEHAVSLAGLQVVEGADFGNGGLIVRPRSTTLDDSSATQESTMDSGLDLSTNSEDVAPLAADSDSASVPQQTRIDQQQQEPSTTEGDLPISNPGDAVERESEVAAAEDDRDDNPADVDFGDLPAPFATRLSDDGARHEIRPELGPWLGERIDAEADGQPDASATGDDLTDQRDEDGISFVTPMNKGQGATLVAHVSGIADVPLFLNAFLDANGDGDWTDPGEHVFVDELVFPGDNILGFAVPTTNSPATATDAAGFRFRISTQAGLSFTGPAPDGEVEDYFVEIGGVPEPTSETVSVGDATLIEGNVGTSLMSFEVSLSNPVDHPVMVAYETTPGTATEDVDYLATDGFVVIPPATNSAFIQVPIVGDLLFEPNETFSVVLTGATAVQIDDGVGQGLIENDDSPSGSGEVDGFKWRDLNGDGLRDGDEIGLAGFTIYADLNGNQQLDVGEPNTVSQEDDPATPADETGRYVLTGVPIGAVAIRELVPESWTQTAPVGGVHNIVMAPGGSIGGADFGNVIALQDGDDLIYAGDAADTVRGDNTVEGVMSVGTRQDTIYGEAGNDNLNGQERDDLLAGGEGSDDIDGGEDIDRVWQMVDADQELFNHLLTGQGPDNLVNIEHATLIGGGSGNVIDADAFTMGSVLLIGLDGDDELRGTQFDDELIGGNGNDLITGFDGNDRYVFESVTTGVAEVDTLVEAPDTQTDILDFQALPVGDSVTVDLSHVGGAPFAGHTLRSVQVAAEHAIAEPSFYHVLGGQGNDTLTGNSDNNILDGNDGQDEINGGTGDDQLDGGLGDDHYVFEPDWATDEIVDGGGTDHADFSAIPQDLLVNIGPTSVTDEVNVMTDPGNAVERITTGSGDDQFAFLHDDAQLAFGNGNLDGGSGSDTLNYANRTADVSVDLGAQTAAGVASVENIENVIGGDGNDLLVGDDLANVIEGGPGADQISGAGGDDELSGNAGSDEIDGGSGDDLLQGNEGHDVLNGGPDSDNLQGGEGSDTYLFGASGAGESDTITEEALGGSDTVQLAGNGTPVHVDMTQDQWMSGAESGRDLTVVSDGMGNANIETVIGTGGDDTFLIQGTNVAINGGAGDDTYSFPDGATGSVTLNELGGAGTDTIDFSQFTTAVEFDLSAVNNAPSPGLNVSTLPAGAFENLLGGDAGDTLTGNVADNEIHGNGGDDVIATSAGTDLLAGGLGDDTYRFAAPATDVTIDESDDATGSDTLDFSDLGVAVNVDLDSTRSQNIAEDQTVQLTSPIENFVGSIHRDTLYVDMSDQPRDVDGNLGIDTLWFDAMGALAAIGPTEITGGGFAPITHDSFETIGRELALRRGDLDGDGEIAFADFLRLSANFGRTDAPRNAGDLNDDGMISFADFLLMSANFGTRADAAEDLAQLRMSNDLERDAQAIDEVFAELN